jgi:hypothetical protein
MHLIILEWSTEEMITDQCMYCNCVHYSICSVVAMKV